MTQNASNPTIPGRRVTSLDAFRGFIMFSMLLHTLRLKNLAHLPVIGFIYNQLNHVPWLGYHFEDQILPSFLCIIGVSMAISDEKRRQKGQSYRQRFFHAFKRSIDRQST